MAQPQLVQIALDSGGHNAIGVDQEGGVWRGRIQRPQAVKSSSSGSAFAPSFRRVVPRRGSGSDDDLTACHDCTGVQCSGGKTVAPTLPGRVSNPLTASNHSS